MSGVGAIGGTSGASMGGASSGGTGPSSVGGADTAQTVNPTSNVQDKTTAADMAGAGQQAPQSPSSPCQGMSTEDSLKLHQTVQQPSGASEGGLDLKKLIELLMAVKLLEAANSQGSGSTGNNLDITA